MVGSGGEASQIVRYASACRDSANTNLCKNSARTRIPDKLKHIGPFGEVVIGECRQAEAYRTVAGGW